MEGIVSELARRAKLTISLLLFINDIAEWYIIIRNYGSSDSIVHIFVAGIC